MVTKPGFPEGLSMPSWVLSHTLPTPHGQTGVLSLLRSFLWQIWRKSEPCSPCFSQTVFMLSLAPLQPYCHILQLFSEVFATRAPRPCCHHPTRSSLGAYFRQRSLLVMEATHTSVVNREGVCVSLEIAQSGKGRAWGSKVLS